MASSGDDPMYYEAIEEVLDTDHVRKLQRLKLNDRLMRLKIANFTPSMAHVRDIDQINHDYELLNQKIISIKDPKPKSVMTGISNKSSKSRASTSCRSSQLRAKIAESAAKIAEKQARLEGHLKAEELRTELVELERRQKDETEKKKQQLKALEMKYDFEAAKRKFEVLHQALAEKKSSRDSEIQFHYRSPKQIANVQQPSNTECHRSTTVPSTTTVPLGRGSIRHLDAATPVYPACPAATGDIQAPIHAMTMSMTMLWVAYPELDIFSGNQLNYNNLCIQFDSLIDSEASADSENLSCTKRYLSPNCLNWKVGILIGYDCPAAPAPVSSIIDCDRKPFAGKTKPRLSIVGEGHHTNDTSHTNRISAHQVHSPPEKQCLSVSSQLYSKSVTSTWLQEPYIVKPHIREISNQVIFQDDTDDNRLGTKEIKQQRKKLFTMPSPCKHITTLYKGEEITNEITKLSTKTLQRDEHDKIQYQKLKRNRDGDTEITTREAQYAGSKPLLSFLNSKIIKLSAFYLLVIFCYCSAIRYIKLNEFLVQMPEQMNLHGRIPSQFYMRPWKVMLDIKRRCSRFHIHHSHRGNPYSLWLANKKSEFRIPVLLVEKTRGSRIDPKEVYKEYAVTSEPNPLATHQGKCIKAAKLRQ